MSSSVNAAAKITTTRGSSKDAPPLVDKFSIYKYLMTPIIFISFLVSLAWVDFRYSVLRHRNRNHHGWRGYLPDWLRRVVYRSQADGSRDRDRGGGRGSEVYYHSKQKKLAKMEMADAFEIRSHVVLVMFALAAGSGWGVWVVMNSLWRWAKL